MKFKIFKSDGSSSTEKDIKEFPTLDSDKGIDALRQVIIAVHANNRQGNASTKLRSEVSGSGKKIFKQKGLGVGRAGDKRAIQRRGGGVIFGPRPRSYNQKINRKVKRLALTRALIDQAASNQICLIEKWEISEAKTKFLIGVIQSIAPKSKKVLVVGEEFSENVGLAARNIAHTKLSLAQDVSPLEIVQADMIIICENGMNNLIEKISENNKS